MLQLAYIIGRCYPCLAIPLGVVLWELGTYFKRKGSKMKFTCWGLMMFLYLTSALWFFYRGDKYGGLWVKWFLEGL